MLLLNSSHGFSYLKVVKTKLLSRDYRCNVRDIGIMYCIRMWVVR